MNGFIGWLADYFRNSWNSPVKTYSDAVEYYTPNVLSRTSDPDPVGVLSLDQSEAVSEITSPEVVSEAADVAKASFGDADWLGSLFETSEQAAINQARRNEEAAEAAYLRSERAADLALQRARELRQTQYQDAMLSLKAAGLNPVLAAGGGIGGSSTTAPQANAPSSSSSMAAGINAVQLIESIAAIISAGGSLLKGISSFLPSSVISEVTTFKGR